MAKQVTSITVESDGTFNGTKVLVNGRAIGGLRDFNFELFDMGSHDRGVRMSYSVHKPAESPGDLDEYRRYYLVPADAKATASIAEVPEGDMNKLWGQIG